MSNSVLEGLVKDKDYIFKKQLFKIIKEYKLTLNELLLLIYFLNQDKLELDTSYMNKVTLMDEKEILESFTSLTEKGLITINMNKTKDGKINEEIDLSNLYRAIVSDLNSSIKNKNQKNIFEIFEKEFGRPLSPMEYEMISEWVKSGMNEDLIIGALKEATFSGVSNLRYIDRIIYEWGRKGFKTMDDVNNHLKQKPENNNSKKDSELLFEYNWLEDEE